jgi:manganese transport protein
MPGSLATGLSGVRRSDLVGRGKMPGRPLLFLGPAFVAAVAYIDPGNFATNFRAGSGFGYQLLWVIVGANLVAMLIQALAAKLGLATGADLATQCRTRLPRWLTFGLWMQAESVAIATDIAEVVGGAVALKLMLGIPVPLGGVITATVAFALLFAQNGGFRPYEVVIAAVLMVVAVSFAYLFAVSHPEPVAIVAGLAPSFAGTESVVLATGILGATVMPHVIYVHSALTPDRYAEAPRRPGRSWRREALRFQRLDLLLAMGVAGLINAAMLIIAARLFASPQGGGRVDSLEDAHATLGASFGNAAALAFALALLASGCASSSVGTYAGQVVMAGYLNRQIPVTLRRCITLIPALLVLSLGVDTTQALVWSQVVLSFGIPFALIPLVWLTSQHAVMGDLTNRWITTAGATVATALIVALNTVLLVELMS